MSLIITGNKLVNSGVGDIGISQKPEHYRNFLKETITLQPDSEVAVQSVKLTKGGGIRIQPDDGFYVMWNKDLAKLDDGSNEYDTTGTPIWCPIGLTEPDKAEDVSIDEYANRITSAMRKGVPHPDLNYIPSSALSNRYYPLADVSYDSSTGKVDGFELAFAQNTNDVPLNNVTSLQGSQSKWFFDTDDTLVSTVDGDRLKIERTKGSNANPVIDDEIVYTGMPTTFKGGYLRVDLGGLLEDPDSGKYKNMTDWAVGLTRSKSISPDGSPEDVNFTIDGLMPRTRGETVGNSAGNLQFYDFVIRCIEDQNGVKELVLGHLVKKDNTSDQMCMREINYWGFDKSGGVSDPVLNSTDGNGDPARYNLTTNSTKITQFLIRVENDIVSFYYYDGGGGKDTNDDPLNDGNKANWKKFCSYDLFDWTTGDDAVNYKVNYPKPINQNTWWMYPKVYIEQDAGVNYHLHLSCYTGVTRSGLTGTYYNPVYDWRVLQEVDGMEAITREIDLRYYNDMVDTKTYDYMTIRSLADPYLKEQAWVVILIEDNEYYPSTTLAQDVYLGKRLGFPEIKLLRPDINGQAIDVGKENDQGDQNEGWAYNSTAFPTLLSSGTLFVRLDNFTQKTLNGAVGRPSKILYTIPSYDINGSNQGLMYYEPQDRVYVKLGNPQPLTINTFDISICDENEVLAQSLLDQTIITLHFRDKPHMN